jgi:DNA repair protein RecO (recombination protein O)
MSEVIVLRTYPLQEADLIVSFLTRDQGKLRGVAKRARRPKSKFGSGLERLSQVRMFYLQKENRELVDLDSCELIRSQFGLLTDYTVSVALDFMAEIADQLLPAHEPNERFFRLMTSVLDHFAAGGLSPVWRGITYYSFWAVRLAGYLPAMDACSNCGTWLDDPEQPQRSFYTRFDSGLYCPECRTGNSWELRPSSRAIAREMLKTPVSQLAPPEWTRETASDLRHFLVQRIENVIERKLATATVLEQC